MRLTIHTILATGVLACLSAPAPAQTPIPYTWAPVNQSAAPSPRVGHGMVFDTARSKIILFGGQNTTSAAQFNPQPNNGQLLNDTWEYDPATNVWTAIQPADGVAPPPRSYFAMAYDAARARVVLYGGKQYSTNGDTWEFDPVTRIWAPVSSAGPIWYGGLSGSHAAYDPNLGLVILYGGAAYWAQSDPCTYALRNGNWWQLTCDGPAARFNGSIATDTARSRVVLYGGSDYNNGSPIHYSDTWEWNGASWTQVAAADAGPSARNSAGFAFDASRRVSVLFGGGSQGTPLADTWEWNGSSWLNRPTVNTPSARETTLAFTGSQVFLFGGGGTAVQNDAYLLQPANRPPVALCRSITLSAGPTGTADGSVNNGSYDPDPGDTLSLRQSPAGPYSIGSRNVTLTATDSYGASSQCDATVTVVDTTPPAISTLSASPNVLWTPDQRMVPVTVSASATDNSGAASCRIVSVSSNEALDPGGDWVITGALTLNLREYRSGAGNGRIYTIAVGCTDAAGNTSTKTVTVSVPHDQAQ